jgi:hypothetical protein
MQVGKIEFAPDYGKWQREAFGGRVPSPMEIDPREVPRGVVHIAGHSPTDRAAALEAGDNTFTRDTPAWRQWHRPPLTAANDNLPNWPKVVAFTGLAGSGKSTAADYLVAQGYQRVKFAGPLKAMLRAMGLGDAHIEGDLKEVPTPLLAGKTPRYAMQTIGTDWGRDIIGPTLWTGLWHATVSDVLDHGGRVVCDDCRFANEVEAVRNVGGRVLRLQGRGGIAGGHVSESQDFPVDCEVLNDGDMDSLRAKLDEVLPLVWRHPLEA